MGPVNLIQVSIAQTFFLKVASTSEDIIDFIFLSTREYHFNTFVVLTLSIISSLLIHSLFFFLNLRSVDA